MSLINNRQLGAAFEQKAVKELECLGYNIIEQNFRCRNGEIDIIAEHEGYIVFVEVKYRKNTKKGNPVEAVDIRKQKVISRVAMYYIVKKFKRMDIACRFDVVSILGEKVTVIKNAFEFAGV